MESDQHRLQPAVKTCLKSKVLWRKHCQELSNGYATEAETETETATPAHSSHPAIRQLSNPLTRHRVLCFVWASLCSLCLRIINAISPWQCRRAAKTRLQSADYARYLQFFVLDWLPLAPLFSPLPVCQPGSMAVDYLTLGSLLRCSGAPPLTWPLSCLTVHHKSLLSQS